MLGQHRSRVGLLGALRVGEIEVDGWLTQETRRLHGYLLRDGRTLFDEVPFDNPRLKVLTTTTRPESNVA